MGWESWSDWVRKWRGERPLRRELRRWNTLTMLATAGLMLSIAALLIVVGIGVTQIAAAEKHLDVNLVANAWFDLGLFVAVIGMLWGAAAIASIGSQAKALREFPALQIAIIAGSGPAFPAPPLAGLYPTTLRPGLTTLTQLRPPMALEPQSTIEGFVVFDFMNVSPHLTDDRKLEIIDHNSSRSVVVDTALGQVHDFT
jgi:hypothetical protein